MKNNDPLNDPVYRKQKIARLMLKFYVKFLAGDAVITDEDKGLCINEWLYVKRWLRLKNVEGPLYDAVYYDYEDIADKIFRINGHMTYPVEGDAAAYIENKRKYKGEFLKMRQSIALQQIETLTKLIREFYL